MTGTADLAAELRAAIADLDQYIERRAARTSRAADRLTSDVRRSLRCENRVREAAPGNGA
jgi:hypothetical protein